MSEIDTWKLHRWSSLLSTKYERAVMSEVYTLLHCCAHSCNYCVIIFAIKILILVPPETQFPFFLERIAFHAPAQRKGKLRKKLHDYWHNHALMVSGNEAKCHHQFRFRLQKDSSTARKKLFSRFSTTIVGKNVSFTHRSEGLLKSYNSLF